MVLPVCNRRHRFVSKQRSKKQKKVMDMKKKVRIIKNNDLKNHGTFFDPHSVAFEPTTAYLENKRDNNDGEKLKDKDKKKKITNKKDTSNRGLKYMNPSQRNHSSIYE